MTHSMTAFARVQSQVDSTVVCWEIKSVNHRYLEAGFRLPEPFRGLEITCRNAFRGKISRGKLDCQLKLDYAPGAEKAILINEGLMNALINAGNQLAEQQQLANDLTVSNLLSWPGVAELGQPDRDALVHEVEGLFTLALDELVYARSIEGKKLKEFVDSRLSLLANEVKQVEQLVGLISTQAREKLLSRLEALQINVADNRIEQEIALMLAKLDVSEEIDRLKAHIEEVSRVLASKEAVGRRLDFLMQELNREANTLSSKSDTAALTQHAVEMKVLIEQMREQIQNIE
ncbi:YicC/YloC family endoribonuclease [Legionella yabuuchiae]|uniref:YicC/YloC family endoribonuclease n=1 Tax=Legionella yabuuchiae TaxID=376727 RepID=UPI001054A470|nr:YicC/YloC family endoribonuclease [Legionella yabuuchiae]